MATDLTQYTVEATPSRTKEIARHLAEVDPDQLAILDSNDNAVYDHVYDNTLPASAPSAVVSDNATIGDADLTWTDNGPASDTYVAYFLNPAVGTESAATIVGTGTLITPAPTTSPHTFTAGAAGQIGAVIAGVNEAGTGAWSAPSFVTIT